MLNYKILNRTDWALISTRIVPNPTAPATNINLSNVHKGVQIFVLPIGRAFSSRRNKACLGLNASRAPSLWRKTVIVLRTRCILNVRGIRTTKDGQFASRYSKMAQMQSKRELRASRFGFAFGRLLYKLLTNYPPTAKLTKELVTFAFKIY